jgi:hypothetical protein
MATCNLRRLCRPDLLRAIDSQYLGALLAPHADYLARHGVVLPLEGREAPRKYMALTQLLLAPDDQMPKELVDALYFIDEMATPARVETLLSAAQARGIQWHSYLETSPADVVLQLWLTDRHLVEQTHAQMAAQRFRAFDYFQPQCLQPPKVPSGLPNKVRALEAELSECFYRRGYGPYARVHLDDQRDSLWFYIGHGGRMRREAAIEHETPTSICYRPEVYDAVVFVRLTGELGIHARRPWEKELYQRVFGKHVFADEDLFGGTSKYTLDPLWNDGEDALRCLDVPGIEWVRLGELRVFEPGRVPRSECFKARDLFGSWHSDTLPLSGTAHLVSAGFHVKLLGCRNPRWVTVRPCNHAQYSRDADRAWIEAWLKRRGFIRKEEGSENANPDAFLAVA